MTDARRIASAAPGTRERVVAAALLAAFALLALFSMRSKSPTFDETTHLASGVSYVQLRDFRMNPEHPALPKALAGAAASLAGARAHTDTPAWETTEQWDYARELLYERGADWRRVLFAGRLPFVAIGVALGLVVWLWTRAMVGAVGAAMTLTLYAFSPSLLAHTRLVTTDVPLTLTVVAAAACLWKSWRSGSLAWTGAAAACVALSMVTKYSAFSYAPVWAVLLLLPSPARPLRRGLVHLGVFAGLAFVLTELAVFASYGFAMDWASIRSLGMEGRGISPADMAPLRRIPYEILASVPWPSASFASGLKDVLLHTATGHPVFLMGMRADSGWWWSSFVALAVKPTLPFLLLTLSALVWLAGRRSLRRADLLFLLLPAALVLATNVIAKLGLGVRHLLPMFPFLMILAAWPLREWKPRGAAAVVLVLALLWHVAGTVRAHPHYLPFFHEGVHGARGGSRLLGDSNLDWGQDLSAAAARLRELGAEGAVLCYFGTASPFAEELEWQLLPPTRRAKELDPWVVLPTEGEQWLAMSVTNLQGVYSRAEGQSAPYPWLQDVEPREIVGESIFLYEVGHDADVQWGMAQTYRRHRLLEEEEASLRRALDQRPYLTEARLRLTEILIARGDLEEAAELILRARNPEPEEVLQAARLQETELGAPDLALRTLQRAVRGYPANPDLKNQRAWLLQKYDGDLDEALELASQAVQWSPDDPYFRDTRGVIHMKRGETREALADLETALTLPGGDLPEVRWHRALVFDQEGRRALAEEEANQLLSRSDLSDELLDEIAQWTLQR